MYLHLLLKLIVSVLLLHCACSHKAPPISTKLLLGVAVSSFLKETEANLKPSNCFQVMSDIHNILTNDGNNLIVGQNYVHAIL